jgi:hypothetical protein
LQRLGFDHHMRSDDPDWKTSLLHFFKQILASPC